jgi:hypothetical protein
MRLILGCCLFLFCSTVAAAQATVSTNLADLTTNAAPTDWVFYADASRLVLDFGALGSHAAELQILDSQGIVVFDDKVAALPSNSLYDLDLTTFQKGSYQIAVQTYKNTVSKAVEVK